MKQSEIVQLTTDELVERIEGESSSLDTLKITHSVSQLENPMLIRQKRKTIARLNTELSKRKLNENK
ncbi:MAG: 50S ribosomal protein L29 [Crocinitomicaceae bacterium]|nr:50S ribosomal protein L29 [Crocinitomicaceae bacterium]|tara:strand:- start:131 stop:331 length:201 start_codon:yes stop_codon:yes gene_type:complete